MGVNGSKGRQWKSRPSPEWTSTMKFSKPTTFPIDYRFLAANFNSKSQLAKMRRESRQMSADWALEVFDKAAYITVSMTDGDGNPYGLPLSLVRTDDKTFWFHCATEGKKLDILKANPRVFLSAVTKCRPLRGPKDGSFTLEFKSATAIGKAEIEEDENTKRRILQTICQRFLPQQMDGFDEAVSRSLHRTTIVKITLTEPPVGKRKQYDSNGDEM